MYTPLKKFPSVLGYPSAITELKGKVLGLDLEWEKDGRITILGLADKDKAVSVPYEQGRELLAQEVRDPEITWVGHNLLQADRVELLKDNIIIDPTKVEDTIIKFWLTNAHLCKTTKKASGDEEEDEKKGRGFMNLGTMLSIYTNLPYYKECAEVFTTVTKDVETGAFYKTGKRKGQPKTKKSRERLVEVPCDGPCPIHNVFGYNGIDAWGPLNALPGLNYHMKTRGVEKLYPLHAELAVLLAEMREEGINIDTQYVEKLREEFRAMKEAYWSPTTKGGSLGFNPESYKQVIAWFKEHRDVALSDNQEETIRDAVEENPKCEELQQLLEYKELGDGPDRWFGEKYLKDDLIHPRLGFYTSSGRLQCAGPNMQNVAKRRIDRKTGEKIGKKVRRAVIAPDGYYLYRADYQNAENRVYLWLAGYREDLGQDFHSWMAVQMGLTEDHPFSKLMGSPRDAAKSVVHATDYLEGIQLIDSIAAPRIRKEIQLGCRVVYPNWKVFGKTVSFTGINLARRWLGEASYENRAIALENQQKYFLRFPKVLDFYREVGRQIENEGAVRPPHGYYLLSYGFPEDRLKQAASVWGSQPVAHLTKLAMLRAKHDPWLHLKLQVHDELLFAVECRHDPREVKKRIEEAMVFETPEIPGLRIPVEVSYGMNWSEQKEIG